MTYDYFYKYLYKILVYFIQAIETLSTRLNHERNRFCLLHLNSDIVNCINILVDNKYICLIENEDNIMDVFHGMCIYMKYLIILYNDVISVVIITNMITCILRSINICAAFDDMKKR